MNDNTIRQLLQSADRAAGEPTCSSNLARRVRIKAAAQQRLRHRVFVMTAAFLLILGVGIVARYRLTPPPNPANTETSAGSDADQAVQQLAAMNRRLQMQVDLLRQLNKTTDAEYRLAKLKRKQKSRIDPLAEIRLCRDKSAAITLVTADEKVRKYNLVRSAVNDYQRVIELYPDTIWARQARKKLVELTSDSNDLKGDV